MKLALVEFEIWMNTYVNIDLDLDPERSSVHLRSSIMKCSIYHTLSFEPITNALDVTFTEIQLFEEMLMQRVNK